MKRILLASSLGFALASGSALAADLPLKAPPAPVPTWTGCYIDGGVGYGMWNQDQNTETLPGLVPTSFGTITDGGRGWLGRVGGGCDYQFGGNLSRWVIGAFGDYDWMSLRGTNTFQNVGLGGVFGAPSAGSETETGAWYVGARIGYLITPSLLTYWDGGYTETQFGQVSLNFTNTGLPSGGFLSSATYRGWFVGGGTEYALNFDWLPIPGLFWRSEYRFAQYQADNVGLFGPGTSPGFGQHSQPTVQTITSSLVWRFNWTNWPVMAKY